MYPEVIEWSKYYKCYKCTCKVINMINEIGAAGWEAWMVVLAPVTSTRWQQCEQSMAWVAVVLNDFPCFPKASCVVDALHGWDGSQWCSKQGCNAAREDALDSAPVKVSEGFCRHAKLLESPQKVEALLGSFYSSVCFPGPGEVILNTPRNLKQKTFSTSAPLMCRGARLLPRHHVA